MHRLQQFVSRNIISKLESLPQGLNIPANLGATGTTWLALTRAELIEAFLWLHLGVELGAFPEEASRDVFSVYLVPFFESLLSPDGSLREEMRSGKIYVAHSTESEALTLPLPYYAKILVEKAMRGEEVHDLFLTQRAGFENPESLSGVFQTLLILYSRFAAKKAVRQFTYEISFAGQNDWERDWRPECEADEVREADRSGEGSASALTLAGYFSFWDHAAKFEEAFETVEERESVSRSDLFRLRTRTMEIQSWRINLSGRNTSGRFDQVQKRVIKAIKEDAGESAVDSRLTALILESQTQALELWGLFQLAQ